MAGPVPFPDADRGQPPPIWFMQPWGGINTHNSRPAIEDNEFAWLQNYIPLGSGNLRTLWSNSAPIYTAPAGLTIVYYYFFNIATVQQCAVFLSDGTAVQVNPVTGATVTISSNVNEFYAGGFLPCAAQWNASGIIIVCESQNPQGYFAWDGNTLFRPGMAAPAWLTNQTPTVMPNGVHGSAVETYQNRAWVTTPAQFGVPSIISQSAPGNGANFSTPSGGGSTPQQDSSLRANFTALQQANGFLYAFGDSSISVISNVQTIGSTTTYSNQNVDPQIGTSWRDSVQPFSGSGIGTVIFFANPQGVFALSGGSVLKVSDDLDGLFAVADFSLIPTGSVAIIFGVKVYCLLIKTLDQNGQPTQVMCMTKGEPKQGGQLRWFLASQDRVLSIVGTNEINSILQTWASDATTLYQCFTTPSATLAKSLQSKFFAGRGNAEYIIFKKLYRFYYLARDNLGTGIVFSGTFDSDFANTALLVSSLTAVNVNSQALQPQNVFNQNIFPVNFGLIAASASIINFVNNSGGVIQFVNNTGGAIFFTVQSIVVPMIDATCYGRLIGLTLGSLSPDFTLIAITLLYSYDAPYGG